MNRESHFAHFIQVPKHQNNFQLIDKAQTPVIIREFLEKLLS